MFLSPAFEDEASGFPALRPFIRAEDTHRIFCTDVVDGLGIAMAIIHLTWAIEDLLLGNINWGGMMHEALGRSGPTLLFKDETDPPAESDQALEENEAIERP